MIEQNTQSADERYIFLRENGQAVPRVRDIGLALNALNGGGTKYMYEVARALETRVLESGNEDAVCDLRQLEFAWNGIGDWQA